MGTMLIDSVPPAMIADAAPHMMRSAANAIACSPDEQKRLIVTAEALTGTPARRLAMRATFSPCSASGIAHPRITSSISEGSIPGARRNASTITVAASSSGLVPRRVPFGALPVGGADSGNNHGILHDVFPRNRHSDAEAAGVR